MGKRGFHILCLALLLLLAAACSTTRSLRPGEYRLTDVKVKVANARRFKTGQVDSYIQQKPGSRTPMLYVYNWSGQTVDNKLDEIWRKIGTPPVIYNPDLVNASVENLEKRLEYLGYYGSTVKADVRVKGKKVKVNYILTLGKRYPIDGITVLDQSYVIPNENIPDGYFSAKAPEEDAISVPCKIHTADDVPFELPDSPFDPTPTDRTHREEDDADNFASDDQHS